MQTSQSQIEGHLDVLSVPKGTSSEFFINGDPEGLRSLAKFLITVADIIEEDDNELLIGDREHFTLQPNFDLSKSSQPLTIGRLEAKLTGNFYEGFEPRERGI